MNSFSTVLHKYVAPFVSGVCFAAASVSGDIASVAVLLVVAGAFGFLGLPAGARMIERQAGAAV